MQISGNYLPSPSTPNHQDLSDNRHSATDRKQDSGHRTRQQTVEYVFQGDVIERLANQQQYDNPYTQSVDPANQSAISSYTESSSTAQRQGGLVDIFI